MTENEEKSRAKFRIDIGPVRGLPGKIWANVVFHDTGQQWLVSFCDLHRIIHALAHCEEEKYPPARGFDGGRRVFQFVAASANAFYDGRTYADLARQFQIPERDGNGTVVQANGANVPLNDRQQPRLLEWTTSGWRQKEWPK